MKKYLMTGLFSCILLAVMAQQSPNQAKVIHVQAIAETEVTPDEIFVQIQLQEYEKKGAGKKDINTIKNEFLSRMKKLGLTEKEVTVQNYSGYDGNYWLWHRRNKQKDPDMKASISYLVKLSSVQQLDEVVKNLDDEATENFYIQKVSHSKLEDYKKQLKTEALRNAKEKATYLAAAVGEEIAGVQQINEPVENMHIPMMHLSKARNMEMASDASEPALNVDFKKIKLHFEAPVSFYLK